MPITWNHVETVPQDAKTPSWYRKALAEREAKLLRMQQEAPTLTVPIGNTAPGWHEVGMELTCIPDSQYPWDADVVKAIQKVRPELVPMWVRWIFLTPIENGSRQPKVFGRHALGMVDKSERAEKTPFMVDMPDMPCNGVRFERPNKLWVVFTGSVDPKAPDLPGAYIPFGWNIYQYVVNCPELSVKELKKLAIDDKREAEEKIRKRHAEEDAYIQNDIQKFVDKQLDNLSENQMRDGLFGKVEKSKPTVVVGKHA